MKSKPQHKKTIGIIKRLLYQNTPAPFNPHRILYHHFGIKLAYEMAKGFWI